ncbi:MAG: hypothetical protein LBO09_04495 [Candidatus Peribacteria bacterium]|jgi:hypothetical protein|nr:hypothetical protein [Candidatus Peribacteria bacterium]
MHQITIIDYTDPVRHQKYLEYGYQNGGYTYSVNILKYQIPLIKELLQDVDKQFLISTTCTLRERHGTSDIYIQFIHDTLQMRTFIAESPENSLAIVYTKKYQELLQQAHRKSILIPMTIDAERILPYKSLPTRGDKEIVYFGNLYKDKRPEYERLQNLLSTLGRKLSTISTYPYPAGSLLPLKDEEAWKFIAQFKYGIGVGLALQEMNVLGLKCLISGTGFGGIVTTPSEREIQRFSNYNSRRDITHSADTTTCIQNLSQAIPCYHDIQENLPLFKQIYHQAFQEFGVY